MYFQTDGSPDPHLYIWDMETNRMEFFNFESGRGEQDELYMNETQDEDASALDKWASYLLFKPCVKQLMVWRTENTH